VWFRVKKADGRRNDGSRRAKIAEKSMISTIGGQRRAVNRSFEVPLRRKSLLFERRIFHSLFATERSKKEGMSAFLEKREAQFPRQSKIAFAGVACASGWTIRQPQYMGAARLLARTHRYRIFGSGHWV